MNFTKMISKVRWLIGLLSIPVFSIGYIKYHYNVTLIGIMLIWICNIWFSMENIKRRIFYIKKTQKKKKKKRGKKKKKKKKLIKK